MSQVEENVIRYANRLVTDQTVIDEFERQLNELKEKQQTSVVDHLKRNFFLSKKVTLKSKNKINNEFIAKKFMLENMYTSQYLQEPFSQDVTQYFITKKSETAKVQITANRIMITSIDKNRIFTTSLKIYKRTKRKYKLSVHLLNFEALTRESLTETIRGFQIKREVKNQFNLIIKKWKKTSHNTQTKSIDEIGKMDFNNLK